MKLSLSVTILLVASTGHAGSLPVCYDFVARPSAVGKVELPKPAYQICILDRPGSDNSEIVFMDLYSRVLFFKATKATARGLVDAKDYMALGGSLRGKDLTNDAAKSLKLTLEKKNGEILLTDRELMKTHKLTLVATEFPNDRRLGMIDGPWYEITHSENFEYRCELKSDLPGPLGNRRAWVDVDFKVGRISVPRVAIAYPKETADHLEKSRGVRFVGAEVIIKSAKRLSCKDCLDLEAGDLTQDSAELESSGRWQFKDNKLVQMMFFEGKTHEIASGACEANEVH